MRKAILLAVLSVGLQLCTGCACLTGTPCAELEKSNAQLQKTVRELEQALKDKDTEIASLRSQLADKDARIADLTNQLAALQNQPKPVATPTGPTGFEGTGEVTRKGGAITVSVSTDLLFDSGKAIIKDKGSLPKIASVINEKYSTYKVHVRGHTDSDPIVKSGWKDNWDLGFNRARAVALQLISDGVPQSSVEMSSLSDTEPHGGGKTKDRRVDIQVVPAETAR